MTNDEEEEEEDLLLWVLLVVVVEGASAMAWSLARANATLAESWRREAEKSSRASRMTFLRDLRWSV